MPDLIDILLDHGRDNDMSKDDIRRIVGNYFSEEEAKKIFEEFTDAIIKQKGYTLQVTIRPDHNPVDALAMVGGVFYTLASELIESRRMERELDRDKEK